MKQVKLMGLGALAALTVLASCDEGMDFGDATGTISPTVTCDNTVVGSRSAASRVSEIADLTADDLTITLTSADGKTNEQFSAAAFPADRQFPIGKYTMTAAYGSADEEGFEKPAVYGATELTVSEGKATRVELTATPNKAMVGITYDESVTNYMTDLKATLHSAGGQYIDYAASETRYAYLKPGEVTVDVTFTKPNGKGGTVEVAKFTAEAQHRYSLGVKLGGDGVGSVESLVITFDETLEQEDVEINISDLILNVPAPEVTLSGIAAGETVSVVEGSSLAAPLRFDIKAPGGIKSAVLTTTGAGLLELGWPAEIDLATASEAEQLLLTSLGFKNIGIFRNPGKFAAFELTDVAHYIPATVETASPVTFALKVTDRNGKVASDEPIGFGIKVDKLTLTLEPVEGYAYAGEETVSVLVGYNGTEPLQNILTVQYLNRNGVFAPTTIADVQPQSRASQTYVVSVNVPSDAQLPIIVKAQAGSVTTDEVTIPVASAPVIAVNNNDVFAGHAWISLSAEDYDVSSKAIAVEISTDGSNFSKATGEQSGAEFHITGGLNPATTYTVRACVGALVSTTATFTTEAATQIENGNLDDGWTDSDKATWGLYKASIIGSPSPWANLNHATVTIGTANIGGGNGTMWDDNGHNGTRCALVQTINYGQLATKWNKPANFGFGELFLGSYNSEAQRGIAFSTRPSALSFWYKYTPYNNGDEQGVAEIKVLDANGGIIATTVANVGAATEWTNRTVALSYPRNASKAAGIEINFKSSNASDAKSVCGSEAGQFASGAHFYIDDVELVY